MEQRDFTMLHISEIPFNMNLDVTNINDDLKKRLSIAFLFVLQYQKGNEASALHAVVRLSLDGSIILNGGATFIFKSKTWDEMSHDDETVRKSDFAKKIIEYALPFINGIMFARVQDTKLKGVFLPVIDASDLVENIKVEEVPVKGV